MSTAIKSTDIGMKRGGLLANLSRTAQLDLIAEGLPILMRSAKGLYDAAAQLGDHPRSAEILKGHALEETSKILILIDLVRCPKKLCASRSGPMMRWFYDHQARLAFIQAQYYHPESVDQLQEYVNPQLESHYLEGEFGEYIMPNSGIFQRESRLYADLITYEEGEPIWSDPEYNAEHGFSGFDMSWQVCQALNSAGAFTRPGLDVVADVWDKHTFEGDTHPQIARGLTREMLSSLDTKHLITDELQDDGVRSIYNHWQMPMYVLNFKAIPLKLEDLQAQRDSNVAGALYDF